MLAALLGDQTGQKLVPILDQRSADAKFKTYPTGVLRVAVVADWQGKPDLSALMKDNVHLLLTAGDNIASIWLSCGEGTKSA